MAVIRDPTALPGRRGTVYPAPFDAGFDGRLKRPLTEALGLTQFGVNVTTLAPGAMSAQRHWHANEDEFVYVLSGSLTLVTDAGEQVLTAGMAAGFPHGVADGHCLVNRTNAAATYLEIGTRCKDDDATYPDIDLVGAKRDGRYKFTAKTGEPYP